MPFPEATIPPYNNKEAMEESLKKQWNKNDLSQVQEKFMDSSNGTNGNGNLQNGLLQYAASEIAKGKLFLQKYWYLIVHCWAKASS